MPAERIFRRHFYWIVKTLLPNHSGLTKFNDEVPDRAGFAAELHSPPADVLKLEFFSRELARQACFSFQNFGAYFLRIQVRSENV
jgi:hypothetical protein